MGCHPNVGADRFPQQSKDAGSVARVVFNYDSTQEFRGRIIRADTDEPFRTVIMLDDGRVVLSTECQYTPESLMLPEVHQHYVSHRNGR